MEASKILSGPPLLPEIDKYGKTKLEEKGKEVELIRQVRSRGIVRKLITSKTEWSLRQIKILMQLLLHFCVFDEFANRNHILTTVENTYGGPFLQAKAWSYNRGIF